MVERVYVCGPMTGLPEYNYPAFHSAAHELRARGFDVNNPAENEPPECGTWEGYLRIALAQVVSCDGLVLLPGWESSRGARLEHFVAIELQLKIYKIEELLHA